MWCPNCTTCLQRILPLHICDKLPQALSLLERSEQQQSFFPTSLDALDKQLHGGLACGTITEVSLRLPCAQASLVPSHVRRGHVCPLVSLKMFQVLGVSLRWSLLVCHVKEFCQQHFWWRRCQNVKTYTADATNLFVISSYQTILWKALNKPNYVEKVLKTRLTWSRQCVKHSQHDLICYFKTLASGLTGL